MSTSSITLSSSLDHLCESDGFLGTTAVLDVHTDEVWTVAWNHDGSRLASASKDKTTIIWRIGSDIEPTGSRECVPEFTLRDHPFPVGALAWSLDDTVLATSADQLILLWDTKTGERIHILDFHSETVSSLVWLPDGSGFVSASLDRRILFWDMSGKVRDEWSNVPIRITDMAVAPDMTRLVTVGMDYIPIPTLTTDTGREPTPPPTSSGNRAAASRSRPSENRMIAYDLKSKAAELSLPTDGELTSVKISADSQFALINHAPNEVHLWDLQQGRLARKFTGQRQGHHLIRSCFGGVDGNFVLSGSEDRNVYVWHKNSGVLLEILSGHGMGSVNSVAWNPKNERMFASCSDDSTIRIWEPLGLYRNVPMDSLFSDRFCEKEDFLCVTTAVLNVHTNEVWNVAWSHDGLRLASASKDKTAIIWHIGSDIKHTSRECIAEFTLRGHPFPVGALAWSPDDSILATSADQSILLWDTKIGERIHILDSHLETVSSLVWLPDGSGFMSASLDRRILSWDMSGNVRDEWSNVPIRIIDMAVTPDMIRLVIIGMDHIPLPTLTMNTGRGPTAPPTSDGNRAGASGGRPSENWMVTYDFKTKAVELSLPTDDGLTSVKISADSRFALINHSPSEVHLWDLHQGRLARKFTGQRQGHHVIRSCFGGGNFVVSGSEDRNIYVWRRDSGVLLKTLSGHGMGSVNSVAWNSKNERMFASCSDDSTIRIWELVDSLPVV